MPENLSLRRLLGNAGRPKKAWRCKGLTRAECIYGRQILLNPVQKQRPRVHRFYRFSMVFAPSSKDSLPTVAARRCSSHVLTPLVREPPGAGGLNWMIFHTCGIRLVPQKRTTWSSRCVAQVWLSSGCAASDLQISFKKWSKLKAERSKRQGTSTKHLGWSLRQLQRTGACKYRVRLTGFQLRGLIDRVWSCLIMFD